MNNINQDELQRRKDEDNLYEVVRKAYPLHVTMVEAIMQTSLLSGKMTNLGYFKYRLVKLVDEGYIVKSRHEAETLLQLNPEKTLLKGFAQQYVEEQEFKQMERDKLYYDTENAKNVNKEYWWTKWFARIGFVISLILFIIQIIQFFIKK